MSQPHGADYGGDVTIAKSWLGTGVDIDMYLEVARGYVYMLSICTCKVTSA